MSKPILKTALCVALATAMLPAFAAELVLISADTGTGRGLEDPSPKAPEDEYVSCMDDYKTRALAEGILVDSQGGQVLACAARLKK